MELLYFSLRMAPYLKLTTKVRVFVNAMKSPEFYFGALSASFRFYQTFAMQINNSLPVCSLTLLWPFSKWIKINNLQTLFFQQVSKLENRVCFFKGGAMIASLSGWMALLTFLGFSVRMHTDMIRKVTHIQ